ncbi:MAG: translocation/assembly module TamB domain-containing protein [Bacteroidaceae bacterium]|nr:translocation/assembly module TamB domain-containing protein [Bacteroidaceae bacterium]
MKYLTNFIKAIIWTIALSYFAVVFLTHLPAVQKRLGGELSVVLSEQLKSSCRVGSVKLGFLNRLEIDDVLLRDRQKREMLKLRTVAVTPDFLDILKGRITITGAQVFGAEVMVCKDAEDEPLNCQFVIDALSGDDDDEPTKLNLRINTLILRNSALSYSLNYLPRKPQSLVDINHINLTGVNANIVLYKLKDSDIDLSLKGLAFKEGNGIDMQRMGCYFIKNGDQIKVKSLDMTLADGRLKSDSIAYNLSSHNYSGDINARYKDVRVKAKVSGGDRAIDVESVDINNYAENLRLQGKGDVRMNADKSVRWKVDIADSNVDVLELRRTLLEIANLNIGSLPKPLTDAGYVSFQGKTEGVLASAARRGYSSGLQATLSRFVGSVTGSVKSGLGDCSIDLSKTKEEIKAQLKTENLQLGRLLADKNFNRVSADVDLALPVATLNQIVANPAKGWKEGNMSLKAQVRHFDYDKYTFKDVLADLSLDKGMLGGTLNVAPDNIASFDADINLDISRLDRKKLLGELRLNNLRYGKYSLAQLAADFDEDAADIQTDIFRVSLTGDVESKNINSTISIYDMARLDKFLALGLDAEGAVDANVNMLGDSIFGEFESARLKVSSVELHNVFADFDMVGKRIHSSISATNDSVNSDLRANLESTVHLLEKANGGVGGVDVTIHPSKVFVRDTLFTIGQSQVIYNNDVLTVNNLSVEHGSQHVVINGTAGRNSNDSIIADINDIDVFYILNFVNFHTVDFTGKASGTAVVTKLFSKPEAEANITVENFTFESGRMGILKANASWNNELEQIDLLADCLDETRLTHIEGYVSPSQNSIDLAITADRTRGECLAGYTKSFFSDVDLTITGDVRVSGPLSAVNLTGDTRATGRFHVKALGTDYVLKNQRVVCVPNEICFVNDTIIDKYGKLGIVNGQLHHKNLSQLTFDVQVAPKNMLCYDFPTYDDEVFFGKAFVTGTCDIIGRPGQIVFNVNAKAEKGSFVEYNASNPDAITGQSFINWNNLKLDDSKAKATVGDDDDDFTSDIRLNVVANIDENSTLRVLMDKKNGDLIYLNGNGDLRATYYNKGNLNLFGSYRIQSGSYEMTIQKPIQKKFLFQSGSQIDFSGEPHQAQLSLKAMYPVNSVPLSDLNVGNSFKNNNVRVECLMDITGIVSKPVIGFDFDLPTVNSDAKSMIRSLINTDQEINQQVIYLLTIGRFYTQTPASDDGSRQSEASLAMQSFLSGTVSQQINKALGTVSKSNNWNFGANIAPGDAGWDNAEYEGVLSGSLFNNRLLINGQFGYRDNPNATSSFIGDFDVRYLLVPNGNIAVRVYNQTNDRYFTRSSLNTQGLGMIFKYDFQRILPRRKRTTSPLTP